MRHNGTAAYHTLGCKLNFAETSTIARQLGEVGYARVDFEDGADVYVINTCSVTEQADKKCRNIVRRARSHNPNAFVTVVGCYAQLKPKDIASIPGVDMVLGAEEKFNLDKLLPEAMSKGEQMVTEGHIKEVKQFFPSFSLGDRTRSFLKIQDGCDYFCSFCTIPLARGKSRSGNIDQVVEQANRIVDQGVKEIVLTGVNIGDYKNEKNETFLDVVKALDQVNGLERIRISSIEPDLLSEEIIEAVAISERFMPHFHIPLQSGSDELLRRMRRRYDTDLYRSRITKIKELIPHASIGIDVIVGFPGETEKRFKETVDLLNELDASYLHVFTYSERKNTTAVRMDGVVPVDVRRERNKQLRILSQMKQRSFHRAHEGQERLVLFESETEEGFIQGFTDNYLKVKMRYDSEFIGKIVPVHLNSWNSDGCLMADPILTLG